MKLSKHAKFWALGALGGVGLFALGVFAQQTLQINPSEQDLFSDLKAVFFLDRNGDEIKSIVRWNASGSTLVTAPTSELTGGEAKNTLQNNASIIGSTDSSNTSAGAFLIATNGGKVEWESMQSFIWGANNTTLSGFNTIAVATKDTNINADNALALASKKTYITAKDAIAIGWEDIKLKGQASLAIWSKIDSAAQGAMVFNANNERLNLNNESNNTFVINVKNGLIVNTNTSANPNIQLTVSGAIKLWEVNNAPAQASPYISTKKVGNVICVCGKVNNGNIAISKYSRNNKQHAEICQKVCNNESPTLPGQCGAAATNYPLGQTQWSTDDFCQWGLGYAGAKPTFPALGGQTTWTCESFPSGGVNCTASRKGCGDGIRAAGEQCDLGTNNGKPDSNCSTSCENVKAPKCWANAKTYLGSDVAWAQPNGFCTDDSVLGEATPAFWNGSTSGQKTWTCKNKNGKNLNCSANRLPPAVAGVCGTTLNTCSAGTLSGQTSIAHGNRWSCDGLYGGSNKTCSRCESGYKYNTTTNICEVDCPNPIYRHTNGVTIKAAACAEAGREYMFEGQKYYVAWWTTSIAEKIKSGYPANRIVTTKITSMHSALMDLTTFNQDISNWDTSNVTSMHAMFYNAKTFDQDLSYWNTSKVTDMGHLFREARSFSQNINDWDVSKVTEMRNMFTNAEKFNQPLNKWKLNSTVVMSQMFYGADSFDQPLDNWDIWPIPNENLRDVLVYAPLFRKNQPYCNWAKWTTKKWNFVNMGLNSCKASCANPIYRHTNGVTIKAADCAEAGKEYLFEGQKYYVARNGADIKAKIAANAYPANRIVTTRVTSMTLMFSQDSSFNQDIGNWDTSKVTNMYGMFYWAEAFNQPLNNWDTSKVTDMSWMFYEALAFNQPLNNWDISKVTNMRAMFNRARVFNQPLNNWDISKVTDTYEMFSNAPVFKANQPYCSWANWSAKKWNFVNMGLNACEANCANPIYRHTNGVTIKAADCAEAGKEYLFEGQKYYVARDKDDIKAKIAANAYPANRIVTTRVTNMSQMFYQNSSFNQDIGNWDTSKVTDMAYMFYLAQAFDQPLNNWDTSNVTSMGWMFYWAQAFNQPLNNWNTSKVTTMSTMFRWAKAFNQPLNNWDTSNVTDMSYMFMRAQAFNQPLNNWDTSKVTYMHFMFFQAQAFNQPLNNWDTSNVTSMGWMFEWAQAFNQPLNNWDTSKVIYMQWMFLWAQAFKANQPYCTWANWSGKKWGFQQMWLNACPALP